MDIKLQIEKIIPRKNNLDNKVIFSKLLVFKTAFGMEGFNNIFWRHTMHLLTISKKGKKAKDYKEKIKGEYTIELCLYPKGAYLPGKKNKFLELYNEIGFDLYTKDKELFKNEYKKQLIKKSYQHFRMFLIDAIVFETLNPLLVKILQVNKKGKLENLIRLVNEYSYEKICRGRDQSVGYINIAIASGFPYSFEGQYHKICYKFFTQIKNTCKKNNLILSDANYYEKIDFIEWKKLLVEFYGKTINNFTLDALKLFDIYELAKLQAVLDYSEIGFHNVYEKNPIQNLFYFLQVDTQDEDVISVFPSQLVELVKFFENYIKNNNEKKFFNDIEKIHNYVVFGDQYENMDFDFHLASLFHIFDYGMGTKFFNDLVLDQKRHCLWNRLPLIEKIYTGGPGVIAQYEMKKLRILNLGGVQLKQNTKKHKLSLEQICYLYVFTYIAVFQRNNVVRLYDK